MLVVRTPKIAEKDSNLISSHFSDSAQIARQADSPPGDCAPPAGVLAVLEQSVVKGQNDLVTESFDAEGLDTERSRCRTFRESARSATR